MATETEEDTLNYISASVEAKNKLISAEHMDVCLNFWLLLMLYTTSLNHLIKKYC